MKSDLQLLDEVIFQDRVDLVRHTFVGQGQELWKEADKGLARIYSKGLTTGKSGGSLRGLIAKSKENKLEWGAVSLIAQELLREGDPLPAELAEWVADVLKDVREGKRPRPTKGAQTTSGRDLMFCMAVRDVVEHFGLKSTRRRAQEWGQTVLPDCCAEGGSACDIVGAAFGMKYKTAERVWSSRPPQFK